MRIAVSGAHRTGKTSLVEALSRVLAGFQAIPEPYVQLEEEGHLFPEMPSLEDFQLQLQRSIETIRNSDGDTLFDRCPFDLLAYLETHEDADAVDVESWYTAVRDAMQAVDLVVFVAIEHPDRITVDMSEGAELRRRVDDELRDIVVGDRWGLEIPTMEVSGSLDERVAQVLAVVQSAP